MALDWTELKEHLDNANPEDPAVVRRTIQLMVDEMTNEPMKVKTLKFISDCGDDIGQLKRLENKVKTIVNTPAA